MPAFDEEAVSAAAICEADMGDETAAPSEKRRLDARGRVLRRGAHLRPPARGLTPMTKSPARKSLRPSGSMRSCGRRSLSASSTTRRITPSCNGAGSRRRCRSPASRSPTAKAIPPFLKVLDRLDRCQRAKVKIRKPLRGMRRRKKKCPGGSAQAFEKARFGEGNPRISLAHIWPGFAQFLSDLAQFGFSLDVAPTPGSRMTVMIISSIRIDRA